MNPFSSSSCRGRLSTSLLLAAALAGCTVGPDYKHHPTLGTNAVPDLFEGQGTSTNAAAWKTAEPAAHLPRGAWWELFGDEELNRLESLVTAGNQQLAGAMARFEQARAQVIVVRSGLFPRLSLAPSLNRQRASANIADRGVAAGYSHTVNTFSVPLDASWELDLWGRVRRQVESARAQLAAAEDETEVIKLRLQAELAMDYFSLRSLDTEIALLHQTAEAYRRSLELTRNRRAGGVASDLDVSQALTQLKSIEAELPALELQRSKLRHAVAILCGQAPAGFALKETIVSNMPLPAIPVSLPSELLERRPDIAAAERRMASANAEVGVAQAAFYPRVAIRGVAGFQSVNAGTLFDWPSRFWAVGPSLDLPLFTGGRNRAGLQVARAAYTETVSFYRQTILEAFQEVEDQLAAQHWLGAQIEAEQATLAAAQQSLQIANNRYKAGLITYLEVATAQSVALTHQRALVRLQAERLSATAILAKAMGGGWQQAH